MLAAVLLVAGVTVSRYVERTERGAFDDRLQRTAELSREEAIAAIENELPDERPAPRRRAAGDRHVAARPARRRHAPRHRRPAAAPAAGGPGAADVHGRRRPLPLLHPRPARGRARRARPAGGHGPADRAGAAGERARPPARRARPARAAARRRRHVAGGRPRPAPAPAPAGRDGERRATTRTSAGACRPTTARPSCARWRRASTPCSRGSDARRPTASGRWRPRAASPPTPATSCARR